MANMFGKFSELQEKVEEAKQELAKLEVEAEAGGGMVKVKANGKRQILSIKLDKDVIDPDDAEMMEDLVVAGVNKALDKAEEAGQERMQKAYKDILPGGGIPGMDLSKLGL
jgi:DNA-binding YbaB/EbfC family protein